jgi:hypothetical protein
MERRVLKLIWLILILGITYGACHAEDIQAQAARVKVQLAHDLPVGASRSDIEHWLDQHGIEYSFDQKDNSIHSIIREASRSKYTYQDFTFDIVGDIQMIFRLNAQGLLYRIEVKPIFTGP